jgi:hypothetical protein
LICWINYTLAGTRTKKKTTPSSAGTLTWSLTKHYKGDSELAENTVSQTTPAVKATAAISIEFVRENTPAVLSTEIALRFQKKHKHILDEIKRIQSIAPKSFTEPNFRPSKYTDPTGRVPGYIMGASGPQGLDTRRFMWRKYRPGKQER